MAIKLKSIAQSVSEFDWEWVLTLALDRLYLGSLSSRRLSLLETQDVGLVSSLVDGVGGRFAFMCDHCQDKFRPVSVGHFSHSVLPFVIRSVCRLVHREKRISGM